MKPEDAGWLAGITDGDGYWRFSKWIRKTKNGSKVVFDISLTVSVTDPNIAKKCLEITGMGKISSKERKGIKTMYCWNVYANELRGLIPEIKHLCVKEAPRLIERAFELIDLPKIHPKVFPGKGGYRQPEVLPKLNGLWEDFLDSRTRSYNQPFLASLDASTLTHLGSGLEVECMEVKRNRFV